MKERQAAERRGRRAETLAALWLSLKGYRILGRRVRLRSGEVDIIAQRGGVLAMVEVKARPTIEEGFAALDPRGLGRIVRAGEAWAAARPAAAALDLRFDLVIIRPWRAPFHVRDAWRDEHLSRSERVAP